ncbi:MAG: hypothetical protein ACREMO_12195 [Gemmatimonadales bacterium]
MPRPARRVPLVAHLLLLGMTPALRSQGAPLPPQPLIVALPASVRYAGLGGASAALSGDAGAVFGNPAGLATIKHAAMEAAFQRYPDGSLETMGAAAFRLYQFDFGGGYHFLQLSDTSSIKANLSWTGTAVYRIGLFALGASGRYVSLKDSAGVKRRAFTTDAGLELALFDIMALGVSVQNLGNNRVSGGPLDLPTSTHVGFSFNFVDPQLSTRLLGTVETIWTDREARRTVFGVEAGAVFYGLGLVARAGYGGAPGGAGQHKASYGAGAVLGRLRVDYAFQRRTTLGNQVHRIGVRWTL